MPEAFKDFVARDSYTGGQSSLESQPAAFFIGSSSGTSAVNS